MLISSAQGVHQKVEKLDHFNVVYILLPLENTLIYSCTTDTKMHVPASMGTPSRLQRLTNKLGHVFGSEKGLTRQIDIWQNLQSEEERFIRLQFR